MQLIDADALFKEFEKAKWYNNADRDEKAEKILLQMPTIEAEPVKHGRWIIFDDGGYKDAGMKCSCCNTPYENYATTFHYCPNCGAKMDGGAENE